jgi:hypothetical protein
VTQKEFFRRESLDPQAEAGSVGPIRAPRRRRPRPEPPATKTRAFQDAAAGWGPELRRAFFGLERPAWLTDAEAPRWFKDLARERGWSPAEAEAWRRKHLPPLRPPRVGPGFVGPLVPRAYWTAEDFTRRGVVRVLRYRGHTPGEISRLMRGFRP